MTQGVGDAVAVDCGGDKIGCSLHFGEGVAHSHSDAGMAQHRGVVAAVAECHRLADGDAEMGCHGCYSACFVGFARCDVGESRIPAGAVARRCACEQLGLLACGDKHGHLHYAVPQQRRDVVAHGNRRNIEQFLQSVDKRNVGVAQQYSVNAYHKRHRAHAVCFRLDRQGVGLRDGIANDVVVAGIAVCAVCRYIAVD